MISKRKKAHAYDRDGTIIGSHTDWAANHPRHIKMPYNQQLSQLALSLPQDEPIIIISNQGGIQWGYKSPTAVINEMRFLMRLLPIAAAYFCPDDGQSCYWCTRLDWGLVRDEDNYRKPGAGMARLAERHGYEILSYTGDLSGQADYANGRDSDRMFAAAARVPYYDVRERIQ
ncbi:hypothetical protein U2F10_02805 [Leptothoe sp. EHU-05/26/07-4]